MKGQKKGKKTFSDGLEEILHHTLFEDNLHDNPSMLALNDLFHTATAPPTEQPPAPKATAEPSKTTKNTGKKTKSFAENLEDFFKESLDEVFDGQIATVKRSIVRKNERPAIGIDVLLQKTLVDEESTPEHTQRVTFVLDAQKIEQLKVIARQEHKQLNEVVLELIELYLQERKPDPVPAKPPKTTKTNKPPRKKSK